MSINIRHDTNDISTNAGAKPSIGGVAFNSMMPVVGNINGAAMTVTTAAATATFTANEIVVKSALGGNVYVLPSYSQAINLATTGAGGMDTGTAPVSGYVALYAIYNPSTATASILATNATSAAAPEIYGGANMPVGYTASALISVWPTNASSQFVIGKQVGRVVHIVSTLTVTTNTQVSTLTSVSISGTVPPNAKTTRGYAYITVSSASNAQITVGGASDLSDAQFIWQGSGIWQAPFPDIPITTQQTIYWIAKVASGTFTQAQLYLGAYSF